MTTLPSTDNKQNVFANTVIGLGLAGIVCVILIYLQPSLAIPETLLASEKLAWYLTRASGVVGYLLMTASTLWGLLLSTKLAKQLVPPWLSLAMHNYLSWAAIGISAFHAFVLLFDSYYTYTVADLLIPFTGPYNPMWVGIGTIGFYIMLLTAVSFYVRKQIGQKNWRRLHYLTFIAYIMSTLHGYMAGTDASLLMPVYIGSGLATLFLTLYRILAAGQKPAHRRAARQRG
ncbi:MAG: hypothetical protein AAF614_34090 [Chloroflexota bacterium]